METFSEEQLKKKYKLNTTSTQTVFSPDQLKSKYGVSEQVPEETRESRISQGLPVGMGDNVEPTFGGNIVRGLVKPFAKLGASIKAIGETAQGKQPTGLTSEYLGNVRPIGEGFDVTKGFKENIKPLKDSVGTGLELASFIPVGGAIKAGSQLIKEPFKQSLVQSAKIVGKEGMVQGGLQGAGVSMQNDENLTKGIINTAAGIGLGGVLGAGIGAGTSGVSRALTKTPKEFTSKIIDKNIRDVFSGATSDIGRLDDMAFKSRKGLELLVNESPNIQIPDLDAPLGSRAVKPFDISKAKPNEFLSAVDTLTRKAVTNAKTAVEEARLKGFQLDVNNAKRVITQFINNGDIPVTTANRMLQQIDNTGGDPVKIFDWVQDVNQKYKNRFEKGTIDDMATSKLANDIAETLRKELNTITDRTGYAETMANVNELKRMLLAVAKKANKQINFGDITSEAGLDAGIALLTSNPAYMARTLASGIFKGIVNKVKNSSGIRSVNSAVKGIQKIPNTQKLPSTLLKQERKLLPPPKPGALRVQLESGKTINQPIRKVIDQGTEIVPRNQSNGLNNQRYTNVNTKIAKNIDIPKLSLKSSPKSKKPSILQKLKNTPNKQGGYIQAYKGETDLTTKILKDLEGKTTVSKQYILDATNRGELKQVERDLIRRILDDMDNGKEYVYHGTSESAFRKIREKGLIPENTTVDNKHIYFGVKEDRAKYYTKSKGGMTYGDRTLRVKKTPDMQVDERIKGGGDLRSEKSISPADIEVKVNGKWTPVQNYHDENINILELKNKIQSKSDTVNVSDFAKKVKSELLPLKVNKARDMYSTARGGTGGRYENIALPDDLRGSVKNYEERIYESPIKTSAGDVHFGQPKDKVEGYFGHTRIEDMADNKTRRVIEVQSDLYQKGNLEKELNIKLDFSGLPKKDGSYIRKIENFKIGDKLTVDGDYVQIIENKNGVVKYHEVGYPDRVKALKPSVLNRYKEIALSEKERISQVPKLQQYNDPTAHFRMIREEIKKASQDGKTKLQFPTGETAMKIEGLGETNNFKWHNGSKMEASDLTKDSVGGYFNNNGENWIITDVLGDGKFKAVPKRVVDILGKNNKEVADIIKQGNWEKLDNLNQVEQFDISGKVDANNPIYKFYEKDVQKYLNKFGGKRVVDDKGVSWIEVPINKEQGKQAIEAFGKMSLLPIGRSTKNELTNLAKSPLGIGAIGGAGAVGTSKLLNTSSKETYQSSEKSTIDVPTRDVSITKKDISELEPILFGELSNRSKEKQELEARIILNIALNRMAEFKKRGKDLTLEEVLKQKNQFQAYEGKEYNKYKTNNLLDIPTQKKKKVVKELTEKLLKEINEGIFEDNTDNAFFYVHNPDGTIAYNNKPLFKDN